MADVVHQCPRCELRFLTESELADHLAVDHDHRLRRIAEDGKEPPPTDQ